MTDLQRVIEGLSESERDALLAMPIVNAGALPVFDDCWVLFNLDLAGPYRLEIAPGEYERGFDVLPLGESVRAALLKEPTPGRSE